jgi:hypothetical protein
VKAEVDELIRLIRSVQGYDPRREAAAAAATPAPQGASIALAAAAGPEGGTQRQDPPAAA